MGLSSYRNFSRSVHRLRMLYEATAHSYDLLFETGRARLKDKAAQQAKIVLKYGTEQVERPLKVVTFHARDVYPELLRSTLLVRLVAAYEAFLVDSVEELAGRSRAPFKTDGRLDFSAEQLLTIDEQEGVYRHIVRQTTRRLTSGGLREIKKFFDKSIGCQLCESETEFPAIEEIHDRRHLFVHRAGYADRLYISKYPKAGIEEGEMLRVEDAYLVGAFSLFERSALHIRNHIEREFPSMPLRRYTKGNLVLTELPENLQYIEFETCTEAARKKYANLTRSIGNGKKLVDVVSWMMEDGRSLKYVIAGTGRDIRSVAFMLGQARQENEVRSIKRMRIGGPKSSDTRE